MYYVYVGFCVMESVLVDVVRVFDFVVFGEIFEVFFLYVGDV